MRHDVLTTKGFDAFLGAPLVATLATYRPDGLVLLSPVWHEWQDGGFNVVSASTDVKARHLRRRPEASLVVYENSPPYRGAEIRATARMTQVGAREALERTSVRYLGPRRGRAWLEAEDSEQVLIRLGPGLLRSWDFADEPAFR